MQAIARSARGKRKYRVFVIGGGTAVHFGWRDSTIDADLYADQDEVFRDIQVIKEDLQVNVEFVRPEDFVPALRGSDDRHVFMDTIGNVSFFHYDPYSQVFSKVVRGFRRDLLDAENFVASRMVDPRLLRSLVQQIPVTAFAGYPALSGPAVTRTVDQFLASLK